jgi:hypothetical protein
VRTDTHPPPLPTPGELDRLIREGREALDVADMRAVLLPPAPRTDNGVEVRVESGVFSSPSGLCRGCIQLEREARALLTPEIP